MYGGKQNKTKQKKTTERKNVSDTNSNSQIKQKRKFRKRLPQITTLNM
jgi:hypothetical protein